MRHILSLSGGRDSAAMALLLAPHNPDLELVFCDTGRELPEVYDFINKIATATGKTVKTLQYCGRDFDWYLRDFGDFLPSPQKRWCTSKLKLIPFERYLGNKDDISVYIGIRADENRMGNYDLKRNVEYRYPLQEKQITLSGVMAILKAHDIELPEYYKWRSTGGCWCCFFQRKSDWAGLRMFHPDLFKQALKDEEKSGFMWTDKPLKRLEARWQPPLPTEDELMINPGPCLICAK